MRFYDAQGKDVTREIEELNAENERLKLEIATLKVETLRKDMEKPIVDEWRLKAKTIKKKESEE